MKDFLRIPFNSNRIFGLDILRAAAIMFVVISHSTFLLPPKIGKTIDAFILDGVTIFFVLSGFLIGGILIKEIDKSGISRKVILNFWIRRWFRTLPNYFLILIILTFLHFVFAKDITFKETVRYYFFSQNLFHAMPYWFFPESWSLSIEEWFYISLPIAFLIVLRLFKVKFKNAILIIIITSILGEIVLRVIFRWFLVKNNIIAPEDFFKADYLFKKQVVMRFDSMMLGVLAAYFNYFYRESWIKNAKIFLLFGIVLVVLDKVIINNTRDFTGYYFTVFSILVMSFGTFLLLPFLSKYKQSSGFIAEKITIISIISYSMYLINLSIVQQWIIRKIDWGSFINDSFTKILIQYGIFWFLVFFLSIMTYKFYEYKMTSYRDKKTVKDFLQKLN